MMESSEPATSGPARSVSVLGGVRGWYLRGRWRRAGKRLAETEVSDLRKTLIIVERQLDGMPISTKLSKRRMELLKERERCRTTLEAWEEKNRA